MRFAPPWSPRQELISDWVRFMPWVMPLRTPVRLVLEICFGRYDAFEMSLSGLKLCSGRFLLEKSPHGLNAK